MRTPLKFLTEESTWLTIKFFQPSPMKPCFMYPMFCAKWIYFYDFTISLDLFTLFDTSRAGNWNNWICNDIIAVKRKWIRSYSSLDKNLLLSIHPWYTHFFVKSSHISSDSFLPWLWYRWYLWFDTSKIHFYVNMV